MQAHGADDLGVAAVEPLGQSHARGQHLDDLAARGRQFRVAGVTFFGGRATVIPRHQRHQLDLLGIEAAQVAVLDEVVGVPVMLFVADVHADVVQQRRVLQPLTLAVRQAMQAACLIEQGERHPSDLLGVFRPVMTALRQLDHAAPPHVRVAIGACDLGPIPVDIVQDQPFAQGQVAQRDVLGA